MTHSQTKALTSNALKLIAMAAMTIDHLTCVIWPNYPKDISIILLHAIGRLAAPIFWFFVAEGYHHTRSFKKYLGRMLLFALISHFAYNFAFGIPFVPFQTSVFNQTSIFWGFACALIALKIADSNHPALKAWIKRVLGFVFVMLAFPADWSAPGALVIVSHGRNRGRFAKQMLFMALYIAMYALVFFLFIDSVYGLLQMGVVLAIPLLRQYNGGRGNAKWLKWLFYAYYPAHLALCGVIRIALHGNVGVMIGG